MELIKPLLWCIPTVFACGDVHIVIQIVGLFPLGNNDFIPIHTVARLIIFFHNEGLSLAPFDVVQPISDWASMIKSIKQGNPNRKFRKGDRLWIIVSSVAVH